MVISWPAHLLLGRFFDGKDGMRYSKTHKEETRNNILNAALTTFRMSGYNGIGVDGIAKAAHVTSGAFYKHFSSKSEAFRMVVSEGLGALRNAIAASQRDHGTAWLTTFTNWYFSLHKSPSDPEDSPALPMEGGCALPTLSPEIARTDIETQQLFEDEIQKIIETISSGLPSHGRKKRQLSWTILALMIGGVVLARSARSDKTTAEISKAIVASINKLSE